MMCQEMLVEELKEHLKMRVRVRGQEKLTEREREKESSDNKLHGVEIKHGAGSNTVSFVAKVVFCCRF